MERRIEEDVDGWPTRPIDGGYDGLRQLAAADFSGAVRANGATLFMLNGRIVGVFDGAVEDFDGASGTAHKAPHPALPLLYAMQERGGETRGKYYTNDTPISEVDQTLSDGGFTGFIELSENVLSGDYYLVYHAGNAMSVAFIGNSGKLVTGEDAFERADDEVGIYAVNDVEVDVRDVPGLGDDSGGDAESDAESDAADADDEAEDQAGDGADSTAGSTDDADDGTSEPETDEEAPSATDEPGSDDSAADSSSPASDAGSTESGGATGTGSGVEVDPQQLDESGPASGDGAATGAEASEASTGAEDGAATTRAQAAGQTEGAVGVDEADEEPDDAEATARAQAASERVRDDTPSSDDSRRSTSASSADAGATGADARTAERDTRATETDAAPQTEPEVGASSREGGARAASPSVGDATTIPSLDPDRSEEIEAATDAADAGGRAESTAGESKRGRQTERQTSNRSQTSSQQRSQQTTQQPADVPDDTFEEEVLEREDRIDRLQQRASNLEAERDEIATERDRLAERVETLEDENESLQAELRQLKREVEDLEAGTASPASTQQEQSGPQKLQPRAALEGTDLFVRYDSKGAATLEDAHDGSASADEVNQNLRLDLHTRFDAAEATVGDEPFQEFLEDTMAYRFVDWLVRKLPYEVRDTGQEAAMRDLYDALPEVDRVEFHGVVELTYEENGETVQAEEPFDVVVRDRMGEALFVADLNDSRDPADADMLVDLQSGATRVKETTGALAGAFAVTRSFFDPDALETAGEATSGSLLSRDSRRSYVKVSRKRGYHLCLVEARGEDLHLNVPEL